MHLLFLSISSGTWISGDTRTDRINLLESFSPFFPSHVSFFTAKNTKLTYSVLWTAKLQENAQFHGNESKNVILKYVLLSATFKICAFGRQITFKIQNYFFEIWTHSIMKNYAINRVVLYFFLSHTINMQNNTFGKLNKSKKFEFSLNSNQPA